MVDYANEALNIHKQNHGKIHIELNDQLDSPDKLKLYYTPGVAAVSMKVAKNKSLLREYTWTGNTVAVISDGSAVLGLGNIGPEGAMPVMEGKALLFAHFASINAVPIILNVHSADEIVAAVKAIAPSFGGINLEDIAAPVCFEVEKRLIEELPIPVMHDDQHGTAIVTLAGLINAAKLTDRDLNSSRATIVGAGAAGVAIAKLIKEYAPGLKLTAVDSKGIISRERTDLNDSKKTLLALSDPIHPSGGLDEAIKGADIFIGVSSPNLLTESMVKSMNKRSIIFAMANPDPEIKPDDAKRAGASIVATGRSDYPNQVNNALAFPGIFRGALDNRVDRITEQHKLAAAEAIASLVDKPDADHIVPSINDPRLVKTIAKIIV